MKKISTSIIALLSGAFTYAQSPHVIFTDDFGQTTERKTSAYTPTGLGYFNFADPSTVDNPYTIGGDPYKYNEQVMAYTVENNYYTVVAPSHLKTSMAQPAAGLVFWSWASYDNTLYLNQDHTGNMNGAVMYVNAGETLSSFYKRKSPEALIPGHYYKYSYYVNVQNPSCTILSQVHSNDGRTLLWQNSKYIDGNSQRQWVKVESVFQVPTNCTTVDDKKYYLSLSNGYSNTSGNDFVIDDIVFEDLGTSNTSGLSSSLLNCDVASKPIGNNDEKLNQPYGSVVTLEILKNDKLADGTDATNSRVEFRMFGIKGLTFYTVPGEGSWSYNIYNGVLTFTPVQGFTGNPTPITYTILDISTTNSQNNDFAPSSGSESNGAIVKITYGNSVSVCTKPPVGGTPEGYSKFGISTQETKNEGWPLNVPNGHIVMESKNKGFVITRNVHSAIANPVEGMLIYDTADKCLKLYSIDNSTNVGKWSCISKSCNE